MAEEDASTEERIRRGVGRTIANWLIVVVSLGVLGAWAWTGIYRLEPGEAAVVLRLGEYNRTEENPGLRWHLPPPLESIEVVNVTEIRREKFGGLKSGETPEPGEQTATFENAIQTADSNIVNLSYVVQYRIQDAFAFVYGMADPQATLRDAAQASVREVVGRKGVDAVLSEDRAAVESEAGEILQDMLAEYFADMVQQTAFQILRISLQVVQPPRQVQDAFDDVIAAQQDRARAVSEAQGDAKEIVERAAAEAREVVERASGYRDAKILEAQGEAQRFEALLTEYELAPEVTRRRLYLETMEEVMPSVEKVIVEQDTVNLVPFFPFQGGAPPPPVSAAPAREEGR